MARRFLLVFAAVLFCGLSYAESFPEAVQRVEKWIIEHYSSTPRSKQIMEGKLDAIIASGKSDEEKLEELMRTFPDVFKKAEKPLIFRPSWRIHSLSLGFYVGETQSYRDVLEEVESREKTETGKASEGVSVTDRTKRNLEISSSVSFDPMKWLGQIRGEYSHGWEKVRQSSELWSQSNQQTFARKRAQITEIITKKERLHLSFSVVLTNNTERSITFDPRKANIPVYMGNQSINLYAKPILSDSITIKPWHSSPDITFRVELNTTTALKLVDFMSREVPTIGIESANLSIGGDVIDELRRRPETRQLELRLPGHLFSWNIRRHHTSDSREVTLREALGAAGDDIRDASVYTVFSFSKPNNEGRLAAVSGIPLDGFSDRDAEERFAVFWSSDGRKYGRFDVDALDKPIPEGVALWLVDLDDIGDGSIPEGLRETIFGVLKALAEKSDGKPVHKYRLARCHELGFGVPPDFKQAVAWYRKAADQGLKEAQFALGVCYAEGKGVAQDLKQAVVWYRKAADKGLKEAQFALGVCYAEGKGVARDREQAVDWYRKAAVQGLKEAQYNLGLCYAEGKGVAQDLEQAIYWYRKAAEQGHADAQAAFTASASGGKITIVLPGYVTLDLVRLEAGTFIMGSPPDEAGRAEDEEQHQVTMTRDFYIGRTEVTIKQWMAVMGGNQSDEECLLIAIAGRDIEKGGVSWHDAMEFCDRLNRMGIAPKGWKFTLPTETQWEYAARGGNRSRGFIYSGGNDLGEVAWYQILRTLDKEGVALKKANELGLYDMSGNVWEWCLDDYIADARKVVPEFTRGNDNGGSFRVIRGGSARNYPAHCRSANRDREPPDSRDGAIGFRVVLVPIQ